LVTRQSSKGCMTADKLIADMFTQFCRDITEIPESQITWLFKLFNIEECVDVICRIVKTVVKLYSEL